MIPISTSLVVWLAAQSFTAGNFAADYVCVYGCRQTDANPRLEREGTTVRCWNEIGGLYVGEFHAPDEIACFGKRGRLRDDETRVEWSDGVIWRRAAPQP